MYSITIKCARPDYVLSSTSNLKPNKYTGGVSSRESATFSDIFIQMFIVFKKLHKNKK